jgi:hypothetical protein
MGLADRFKQNPAGAAPAQAPATRPAAATPEATRPTQATRRVMSIPGRRTGMALPKEQTQTPILDEKGTYFLEVLKTEKRASQKPGGKDYWQATCMMLESDNPNFPAGKECKVFQTVSGLDSFAEEKVSEQIESFIVAAAGYENTVEGRTAFLAMSVANDAGVAMTGPMLLDAAGEYVVNAWGDNPLLGSKLYLEVYETDRVNAKSGKPWTRYKAYPDTPAT